MTYILDAAQMRAFDNNTIESHHIPSLVLMERAALACCNKIKELQPVGSKLGVLAGPGNNGGDGVAIARILHLAGYHVSLIILGDSSKYSDSLKTELDIASSYGLNIKASASDSLSQVLKSLDDCQLLVDAIFGIGQNREITGNFAQAVAYMNNSAATLLSVDIPTGFNTDTGNSLGIHASADLTVTFSFMKKGLVLSDCALHCGQITLADVGIYDNFGPEDFKSYILDEATLDYLPIRPRNANKGSQGKVLIIAGCQSIYGACYLSAEAALRAGSGLVRIYTHQANIASIQQALPEAMYTGYTSFNENELIDLLEWADTVLIGPGLSTSDIADSILSTCLKQVKVPLVIDADGINLTAHHLELLDGLTAKKIPVILTPHLKEMERLTGLPLNEINKNMEKTALDFVKKHPVTLVLKNYTTLITGENCDFFCSSGNEGLATPGSGDVLAGIITSLLGQGLSAEKAACLGAYLHGLAGSKASREKTTQGVLARDIIKELLSIAQQWQQNRHHLDGQPGKIQ